MCDNAFIQSDNIQSDNEQIFSDFNNSSSVVVKATVNSEFVNILLDTGAGVCLIDLGTLEKLVKLPKENVVKGYRGGGGVSPVARIL